MVSTMTKMMRLMVEDMSPPHPNYPKQVYVCNDDDVMFGFGLCHPKGEQVRGRCPTELVTAPNVLVTTPVPPPPPRNVMQALVSSRPPPNYPGGQLLVTPLKLSAITFTTRHFLPCKLCFSCFSFLCWMSCS